MNTLLAELIKEKTNVLDYYHDHRPLIAEIVGRTTDDCYTIQELEQVYNAYKAMTDTNEQNDMYYITGVLRGLEYAIEIYNRTMLNVPSNEN